jgi:hypothetical protein
VREHIERYLAASPENRDRFLALAPEDWKLTGSCVCGEVQYRVAGPLGGIGHCHCRRCRKAHSAAFGSFAVVRADSLTWQQGEEYLTYFGGEDASSITFCRRCGTTFTGAAPEGQVALAVGTLDVDPISRPLLHASVGDHASWFEIADDETTRLEGPYPPVNSQQTNPQELPK